MLKRSLSSLSSDILKPVEEINSYLGLYSKLSFRILQWERSHWPHFKKKHAVFWSENNVCQYKFPIVVKYRHNACFFPLGEENLPKKVPLDMTLIVSSEKNVSLNSGEKWNQILEVRIISDIMFFSFPVPFKFKVPEISVYFNTLKICHCLLRLLVSVTTFMSSVSSSNINPFPTLL